MKRSKSYPTMIRHWYRPAEYERPLCHRTLRQAMTLSRRTVVTLQAVIKLIHYLFDASCTLLRAASEAKEDQHWLAQVKENGGIIVSGDGIQPDRGNETIYLVRDALTGRMLAAENVLSSETEVMKALLAPLAALDVKVLGTITEAQESELRAVEQLWPDVPHQVCQFHILREASRPSFELDRKLKTTMRKRFQPKVRLKTRQSKPGRISTRWQLVWHGSKKRGSSESWGRLPLGADDCYCRRTPDLPGRTQRGEADAAMGSRG